MLFRVAERVGGRALGATRGLGRTGVFLAAAVWNAVVPPYRRRDILKQIHFFGVKSLFVIMLTAAFTGMVLSLQGYYSLRKFGSEGLLGAAVALSLIRELGPVLTALMVTGRAGSALAAEIGIMRIGDQIDSLETMGIDPVRFLVAPRIVAALVSIPLLTAIFDVVGIYGGSRRRQAPGARRGPVFRTHEGQRGTRRRGQRRLEVPRLLLPDRLGVRLKGFFTERGAEGVSRATTSAVVISSVLVLIGDYVLTSVLL